MHTWKIVALAVVACALAGPAAAQKKKKEITQTLQLPKDLPQTAIGDTKRLTFHVTPLSAKGLLSAQVRDALKILVHETGNNPVVHIRAFTAGSGDLRRVRDLVSETFTDKKLPLPSLSLVQSGGLPLEGAQVVLEAVSVGKKDVNPQGLLFVPAAVVTAENPLESPSPLAAKSLEQMKANLKAAGSGPENVVRVTCYLSLLDRVEETRKLVVADYPRSAMNFVQTQRVPNRAVGGCEAVARAGSGTTARVKFVPEEGELRSAVIGSPKLVFSGTQVSYGYQEADSKLAFERLMKSLEGAGVTKSDIAVARYYSLADPIAAQIRNLGPGFFGAPATWTVMVEGLPSMQAGFAVDVIAAKD